jgi:hypothetical protein
MISYTNTTSTKGVTLMPEIMSSSLLLELPAMAYSAALGLAAPLSRPRR